MTQEALKLAIQLRDTASGYWTENEIPIIAKLIEALAQPEQEPVAWMVLGDGEYGEYTPGMHFDTVGYKEYWERRGYELQPLYTAPPQRTWVSLTDEEKAEIWSNHETAMVVTVTESILKAKNT